MHRAPQGGHGGHGRTLFGPPAGGTPTTTVDPGSDAVTLDPSVIDGDPDQIDVDTTDGTVTAKRDNVVRRGSRDATWFGRTPGQSTSNVVVTVVGDKVSAEVSTDKGTVAAHSTGDRVGARTKLDPGVLKEESDPVATPDAADAAAATAVPEVSAQAAGDTVIDVMIVFNSHILRNYGNNAATVKATATKMIDKANKSFTDSQIHLQYRLVNVSQVPDAEVAAKVSWYGRDNISALRSSANNGSTNVGRLRNQYGADHNIGGGHDRITSNQPSGGGDAFGMVDKTHRFLTIMGYPQNCGQTCVQTWTFSNPAIKYNGYPTGIAGSIDNARVMNIVGKRIAANVAPKV
jgi:hypothetical protein